MADAQLHTAEVAIDASGAQAGAEVASRAFDQIAAAARAAGAPMRLLGQQAPVALGRTTEASRTMGASVAGLASQLKVLAAAFGAYKLVAFGKDAIMLAARFDELGIVVREVGKRSGVSSVALQDAEAGLRQYGIAATETREQLLKFIQAHLNLADATKLARVAQDAAVVGGLNSSQTLQRITHGIVAGQSEVLRTVGITVSFEQAYKQMAKTVGGTVESLTNAQRTQARMNAVMKEGARLSGAYEASMQSASKQMRSWPRYLEDIKIALGTAFGDTLKSAVFLISDFLKGTAKFIEQHKFMIAVLGQFMVALTALIALLGAAKVAMVAFAAITGAGAVALTVGGIATAIAAGYAAIKSHGIKKEQTAAAETDARLKAYKKRYDAIVEKVAPRKESDPERQSVVKALKEEYNRTNTVIATKLAERNTAIAKARAEEQKILEARNAMAKVLGNKAVSSETEIGVRLAAARALVQQLTSETTVESFKKGMEEIQAAAGTALGFLQKLGVGVPKDDAPDSGVKDEARDRFKELVKDLEQYERKLATSDPFFEIRERTREMGESFVEAGKKAGISATKIEEYLKRIGAASRKELGKAQADQWKEQSRAITEQSSALVALKTANAQALTDMNGLTAAYAKGEDAVKRYNEDLAERNRVEELVGQQYTRAAAEQTAADERQGRSRQDLAQTVFALIQSRKEEQATAEAQLYTYNEGTDEILKQVAATTGGTKALKDYTRQREIDLLVAQKVPAVEAAIAVARREEANRLMQQAASDAEQGRQIGENLTRGLQTALSGFFSDLFTKGIKSWTDFTDRIKQLFHQMLAELLAVLKGGGFSMQTAGMQTVAGMGAIPNVMGASKAGGGGGLSGLFGKPLIPSSAGALLQGAGGVFAGGMIGYSLGYSTGNKTMGVLGGAAGGAAAGAAMGGVPGAIAGAIVGGVAGWFGASKKAKETAKQLAEAQKEFARSLDDWHRTAMGTNSTVVAELRRAEEQREALRKQANAAMPGKKYEGQRNATLSQIDRDYALIREQIMVKYRESLQGALESLKGDDWSSQFRALEAQLKEFRQAALEGYLNTADVEEWYALAKKRLDDAKARDARQKQFATADFSAEIAQRKAALGDNNDEAARIGIERNRQREVLALQDLLDAGTITTEMFEEMTKVIGDEATKALADYLKAVAEQRTQMMEDLAVRQAVARKVNDDELERLQLATQHRRELVDVTDETIRQEILRTQTLEQQALLQAQAERATQRMEDLNLRAMQASGVVTEDEIARRSLEIQQRRELAAVTDATLRAQLEYVQGLEREALARQLAERARQQQEDIRVRTLRATGAVTDDQLEMIQLEIQQRRELTGVTDAALAAQLAYVQGLEREVLLKAQAERARQQAEGLEIRRMRATGATEDDIARRQQEIEQRRELAGVTDAVLRAQIEYVQGLEREALAKQIAETARQRAEDRELRWMRARGATEEALERKRIEIEQRRELRLAANDAEREELAKLHKAELAMFDAASAAAAGRAAVEAANKGTVSGALQTATVSQADRMISLLEAIAANTAGMRGGLSAGSGAVQPALSVDTLLGANYLSQRRLTGNARVEVA